MSSSPDKAVTDAGIDWAGRATRCAVTMISWRIGDAARAAPGGANATRGASKAAQARPAIELAHSFALARDMTVAPILPQVSP